MEGFLVQPRYRGRALVLPQVTLLTPPGRPCPGVEGEDEEVGRWGEHHDTTRDWHIKDCFKNEIKTEQKIQT